MIKTDIYEMMKLIAAARRAGASDWEIYAAAKQVEANRHDPGAPVCWGRLRAQLRALGVSV